MDFIEEKFTFIFRTYEEFKKENFIFRLNFRMKTNQLQI